MQTAQSRYHSYPRVEKPAALFAEYYAAREARAITSLEEFPEAHRWRLEEVKAALFEAMGKIHRYYLVSSWQNGGYITPECPADWQDLKMRKRTWDGRYPQRHREKTWSDFDINVTNYKGAVLETNGRPIKLGFATRSGLQIDIYPPKRNEFEHGILINPEIEDYIDQLRENNQRVERVSRHAM